MRTLSNRDTVIKVGAKLFLQRGYHQTSMDSVVAESGVSKSNIYYHFSGKEALTLAVLDYHIVGLKQRLLEAMQEEAKVLPRMRRFTDAMIDELAGRSCEGGCPLLNLLASAGAQQPELRERIQHFFQEQVQQLAEQIKLGQDNGSIRAGIEPLALASLLLSWMEGSLMLSSVRGSVSRLRMERDVLFQLLTPEM